MINKISRVMAGIFAVAIIFSTLQTATAVFAADAENLESVTSVTTTYYADETAFVQALRNALKEHKETIALYYVAQSVNDVPADTYTQAIAHTGAADEGDYLWSVVNTDSFNRTIEDCGEFKEGNLYKYVFTITYYTTKSQEDYVTSKVSSIISSLGISGKGDYEKVAAIYDYLTENFSQYDGGSYADRCSAYVLLKNGKGNCRAFSSLFYRLCLTVGVDARLVRSDNHAWNIVKVDGTYYCVDAMWGTVSSETYFLKGTDAFMTNHSVMKNSCYYSYSVSTADYDVSSSSTVSEPESTGTKTAGTNESAKASAAETETADESEVALNTVDEDKATIAELRKAYIDVLYAKDWTAKILQSR